MLNLLHVCKHWGNGRLFSNVFSVHECVSDLSKNDLEKS